MRLVFLGPPGGGKGTQAEILAGRRQLPAISTGQILREAAQSDTLGPVVRRAIAEGSLVPDSLMIRIVEERLARPDCKRGFILDGYPRTVGQADDLARLLERMGQALDGVILLHVDEEQLVERLAHRRICSRCGASYHLRSRPPAKPGLCDRCGGALMQRDDDREEVVRERFRTYREKTLPLVDYYAARGLLHAVDGDQPIELVAEAIERELARIEERKALQGHRGAGPREAAAGHACGA